MSLKKDRDSFKWACVEANKQVRSSGVPTIDGIHIPVVSKWNFKYLEYTLRNYHDKEIIELLKYGFPVECEVKGKMQVPRNHAGARDFPDEISKYIEQELDKGTLIGPFDENPFGEAARFLPMNTRPKKDSSKKRVILDLSHPQGESINLGINKDRYRGQEVELKLPGLDALVELILKKGRGCKIFRRDLAGAYKQVPVCLGEIHLLGYTHLGKFYYDLTLPMGLKNSAYLCQKVTDMLIYLFQQEGFDGTNYLDDLAATELEALAEQAYYVMADILEQAGALEAWEKAIPPATRMLFLGILLDTIRMRLEIDSNRLQDIRSELAMWLHKDSATLKEVQSLVGKLSFCATVVKSGRLFFSRILNFMRDAHFAPKAVNLNKSSVMYTGGSNSCHLSMI